MPPAPKDGGGIKIFFDIYPLYQYGSQHKSTHCKKALDIFYTFTHVNDILIYKISRAVVNNITLVGEWILVNIRSSKFVVIKNNNKTFIPNAKILHNYVFQHVHVPYTYRFIAHERIAHGKAAHICWHLAAFWWFTVTYDLNWPIQRLLRIFGYSRIWRDEYSNLLSPKCDGPENKS